MRYPIAFRAIGPRAGSTLANMEKVRVSKLMSQQGLCSRREADSYIERGWVLVNGERVTELGTRIDPASRITLNKAAQASQLARVTRPLGDEHLAARLFRVEDVSGQLGLPRGRQMRGRSGDGIDDDRDAHPGLRLRYSSVQMFRSWRLR